MPKPKNSELMSSGALMGILMSTTVSLQSLATGGSFFDITIHVGAH